MTVPGTRRPTTIWLDAPEELDALSRARLRDTVLRAIDRVFAAAGMVPAVTAAAPEATAASDTARYQVPSFADGGTEVDLPVVEEEPEVGEEQEPEAVEAGGGLPVDVLAAGEAGGGLLAGAVVPARRPGERPAWSGRQLATPPETGDRIDRFLAAVAGRIPDLAGLPRGRLRGNLLTIMGGAFTLHTGVPLGEGGTVSGVLGPGVFHLRPVPRSGLGVAALAPGGAYEAVGVESHGRRVPAGLRVVTYGLPAVPGGLLVYSPRTLYMPELLVEGRPPADVAALARQVELHLDTAGSVLNPALTAYLILATLGPRQLTNEETMALLLELREDGRLGEFLNLVRLPRFRQYLRDQGVDWSFIYAHWEPSFNDSGLFFAGFLFGAGESVADALRLVAILIGGSFSEELAEERSALFEGVRRLVEHPVLSAVQGARQLVAAVEDALWELEFFEAGRILGNLTVVLLTLPSAIRALPRAVAALAGAAVRLATLTLAAVRQLGVSLRALAAFLREPAVRMVTAEGLTLMKVGEEVVVLDRGARPLGRLERLFTAAEVEEWARTFGEPGPAPLAKAPLVAGAVLVDLEDVVRRAIAVVRARLGSQWLPPRQFGTLLHQAVEDLITATVRSGGGFRIFAEQPLRQIIRLTAEVAEMTVAEFLEARPHLRQFLHVPAELLEQKVGNLVPDLVILEPGGAAVVWDLTSVERVAHLAKTQLYAHLLQELGNLALVRIGETYWATRIPAGSAAAALPAAGAATRTAQEQDR
jgi:hypothetical protein